MFTRRRRYAHRTLIVSAIAVVGSCLAGSLPGSAAASARDEPSSHGGSAHDPIDPAACLLPLTMSDGVPHHSASMARLSHRTLAG
jgi:hypothetical protein